MGAETLACCLTVVALGAIFAVVWLLSRRSPGVSTRDEALRQDRLAAIAALKRAKRPWTRFVGALAWIGAMVMSLRSGVPWIVGAVFVGMASAVCGSPFFDFLNRVVELLERWLDTQKGLEAAGDLALMRDVASGSGRA